MRTFRTARRLHVATVLIASVLAGCGGGGGGGGTAGPPPPAPTATPFPGATTTLADISGSQNVAAYAGYGGAVTLSPSTPAPVTVTELTSLIPPIAVPSFPPDASTGTTPTALVYISLTSSGPITLEAQPTLSLTLATAPPTSSKLESAYYNSADAADGWVVSTLPRQSPGSQQIVLYGSPIVVQLGANAPYVGAVLEVSGTSSSARVRRP